MSAPAHRHEDAVARCFEAWNAEGPAARAKAVTAAWTEDGGYTDPPPSSSSRGTPSRRPRP